MDDLNGDGRLKKMMRAGGLGVYGSTSAHGPFVHVDVRGTRARW